jgi:type IX secretion system PorP/SprF family membrane protein
MTQMKKISLLFVLGILLNFSDVFAQQDPQYTQYMYNMNVLNPAYAGSRGTLSLGMLGRTQWTGVDGAPKTFTFDAHAPLGKSLGAGFSVIADEIGPAKEKNIYADISYTIQTSDVGRLAFGLKGGVTLLDVNMLGLIPPEDAGDPSLDDNINETSPNFGAGIFYYTNHFYAGFSVPNILRTKHLDKDNISAEASEEVHYFFTTGYVWDVSDNLKFKPSIMVKGVSGAPLSFDLNANFLMYERLELGASYRFDDSISGIINFAVTPDFRIGYAYDYTISEFSNGNPGGSHEVILLYDINFSKKNLKSPRFF